MKTEFMQGCRSLVGIDGCFLKGPYKGVLLTVISLDANNGYFPHAYGIVEKENKDHRAYFFRPLRLSLKGADFLKLHSLQTRTRYIFILAINSSSFYIFISYVFDSFMSRLFLLVRE